MPILPFIFPSILPLDPGEYPPTTWCSRLWQAAASGTHARLTGQDTLQLPLHQEKQQDEQHRSRRERHTRKVNRPPPLEQCVTGGGP